MTSRASKFRRKHFDNLKNKSLAFLSPLEVIAHVDLDAFYAQCEQVRLGLPTETPVVCQQWRMLIAVNYPARKYGISRIESVESAKKKCAELVASHVATYKKGETNWAYHSDPNPVDYKVSLDPFRRESRKIFAVFKQHCDRVEKIGSDEGFMELGSYVYKEAVRLFPQLSKTGDQSGEEMLPDVPAYEELPEELKWDESVLFRSEVVDQQKVEEIDDWDDILVLIGSVLVARIRRQVLKDLGYTCSAGIARNKTIAKLATGKNKPNNQTVVKKNMTIDFLKTFEFSDMWGLGGKYGDRIIQALNAPSENSIEYIQSLTLEQLKEKLDHSDAQHVYNLVRGEEPTEIITRTEIKSMQSIKNFSSKGLKTFEDCKQWMKVFAADLANRILDLDHDYDIPPRPKKVSLSYNHYTGHGKQSKSKIGSFPDMFSKDITFEKLSSIILDAGCQLIKQLEADAASNSETIYPCNLLNLTVTGIEKIGPDKGSKSLENFFAPKKPDEPKQVEQNEQDESERMDVDEADRTDIKDDSDEELFVGDSPVKSIKHFICERCSKRLPRDAKSEHGDWHFAKDLHDNQQPTTSRPMKRSSESSSVKSPPPKKKTTSNTSSKKSSGQQSLLKFFRSS